MCWNYPDCNAKIHPQEIQAILTRLDTNAADYPEVTAENKARYRQIYDVYRNNYNRKFQQRGGTRRRGRRQHGGDGEENGAITPFFVEANDAQCMLPRRANAPVPAARKRKTLRRRRSTRGRR